MKHGQRLYKVFSNILKCSIIGRGGIQPWGTIHRYLLSWRLWKIEDDAETLMVVKTQRKLFDDLSKKVKELHSYTVPEIIAIPIVEGSADYLNWLKEVTG